MIRLKRPNESNTVEKEHTAIAATAGSLQTSKYKIYNDLSLSLYGRIPSLPSFASLRRSSDHYIQIICTHSQNNRAPLEEIFYKFARERVSKERNPVRWKIPLAIQCLCNQVRSETHRDNKFRENETILILTECARYAENWTQTHFPILKTSIEFHHNIGTNVLLIVVFLHASLYVLKVRWEWITSCQCS